MLLFTELYVSMTTILTAMLFKVWGGNLSVDVYTNADKLKVSDFIKNVHCQKLKADHPILVGKMYHKEKRRTL